MKRFVLIFLLLSCLHVANAKHITGGEIIYDYKSIGNAPNSIIYTVTLRLFRDNSDPTGAAMPPSVSLGIFNNDNNMLVNGYQNISLNQNNPVGVVASPPCLTNAPMFDYSIGTYIFDIELPINSKGYTITYQTCCRVAGISNIGGAPSVGATYVGTVPGAATLPSNQINSSPRFQTGISIICKNKQFILDFSSIDPDGDSLVYDFIDAYNGGEATNAGYSTPEPPPYGPVPYSSPYSGFQPLDVNATINPQTGIISGIAPDAGKYIVSVIVYEYRNGLLIENHRKDFIVTVAPCDFASSDLKTSYTNCDNFDFVFNNESTSALNLTFDWDFGEPASGTNNTSTLENPPHTYLAAGTYTLTLIVNKGTPCADTATSQVRVYPGFNPAFAPIPNMCKNTPVQFTDATTATYGPAVFWRWDFGVQNLSNDTSRLQNPTYTYTAAGTYNAEFIVETSRGCRDTLYPVVTIVDKPEFFVTNDTLICTIDTLQLKSNVTMGTVTWSPNYNINSTSSYNPLVSPDVSTTYIAMYSDNFGCSAIDSVKVNVVNEVTLLKGNDTTICRTDTARLTLNTDAIYFNWTPSAQIIDPTIKNPLVYPTDSINTFYVKASISNKCFKTDTVMVKTVPYPAVSIIGDNPICFGKSSQLLASGGSIYTWTPATYLTSTTIPNPKVVFPRQSISYTVMVRDTFGCPKPVTKVFALNVIKIIADAGPSDTSVVLDQPLQLTATGSTNYLWTPDRWLSNAQIFNPIALPKSDITYTVQVSNSIGCVATDTIKVKVFFLPPDLYVPSAFTPNKNGTNDVFRPIALGIKKLEKFSVYNRWGELVFTTNIIDSGWDGNFKGEPQPTGTFVWQATAIDYKNNKIFRKGNVILIR